MTDSQHGRLIVLCGPAGVGKGTVLGRVREQHPEIWLSVSATTRQPRPGEVDGVNYFFMPEQEFSTRKLPVSSWKPPTCLVSHITALP